MADQTDLPQDPTPADDFGGFLGRRLRSYQDGVLGLASLRDVPIGASAAGTDVVNRTAEFNGSLQSLLSYRVGQDQPASPPVHREAAPEAGGHPDHTADQAPEAAAEPQAPAGPIQFGSDNWFARMAQRQAAIEQRKRETTPLVTGPSAAEIEAALGIDRAAPAAVSGDAPVRRRSVVHEMSGAGVEFDTQRQVVPPATNPPAGDPVEAAAPTANSESAASPAGMDVAAAIQRAESIPAPEPTLGPPLMQRRRGRRASNPGDAPVQRLTDPAPAASAAPHQTGPSVAPAATLDQGPPAASSPVETPRVAAETPVVEAQPVVRRAVVASPPANRQDPPEEGRQGARRVTPGPSRPPQGTAPGPGSADPPAPAGVELESRHGPATSHAEPAPPEAENSAASTVIDLGPAGAPATPAEMPAAPPRAPIAQRAPSADPSAVPAVATPTGSPPAAVDIPSQEQNNLPGAALALDAIVEPEIRRRVDASPPARTSDDDRPGTPPAIRAEAAQTAGGSVEAVVTPSAGPAPSGPGADGTRDTSTVARRAATPGLNPPAPDSSSERAPVSGPSATPPSEPGAAGARASDEPTGQQPSQPGSPVDKPVQRSTEANSDSGTGQSSERAAQQVVVSPPVAPQERDALTLPTPEPAAESTAASSAPLQRTFGDPDHATGTPPVPTAGSSGTPPLSARAPETEHPERTPAPGAPEGAVDRGGSPVQQRTEAGAAPLRRLATPEPPVDGLGDTVPAPVTGAPQPRARGESPATDGPAAALEARTPLGQDAPPIEATAAVGGTAPMAVSSATGSTSETPPAPVSSASGDVQRVVAEPPPLAGDSASSPETAAPGSHASAPVVDEPARLTADGAGTSAAPPTAGRPGPAQRVAAAPPATADRAATSETQAAAAEPRPAQRTVAVSPQHPGTPTAADLPASKAAEAGPTLPAATSTDPTPAPSDPGDSAGTGSAPVASVTEPVSAEPASVSAAPGRVPATSPEAAASSSVQRLVTAATPASDLDDAPELLDAPRSTAGPEQAAAPLPAATTSVPIGETPAPAVAAPPPGGPSAGPASVNTVSADGGQGRAGAATSVAPTSPPTVRRLEDAPAVSPGYGAAEAMPVPVREASQAAGIGAAGATNAHPAGPAAASTDAAAEAPGVPVIARTVATPAPPTSSSEATSTATAQPDPPSEMPPAPRERVVVTPEQRDSPGIETVPLLAVPSFAPPSAQRAVEPAPSMFAPPAIPAAATAIQPPASSFVPAPRQVLRSAAPVDMPLAPAQREAAIPAGNATGQIQRVPPENEPSANTPEQPSTQPIDFDRMAEEVWPRIRRKLRIERERERGLPY